MAEAQSIEEMLAERQQGKLPENVAQAEANKATGQELKEVEAEVKKEAEATKVVEKKVSEKKSEKSEVKTEAKTDEPKTPKKKFWKTEEPIEEPKGEDETATLRNRLAELEKREADYKAELESEEYTKFKDVKKVGVEKYVSEIVAKNPMKKTSENLLTDAAKRALNNFYGEGSEEITQDMIEEQIDILKNQGHILLDKVVNEEKNIQLKEYSEGLNILKAEDTNRSDSLAKDIEEYVGSLKGKDIDGLPVTEDRLKEVQKEIEDYSKGTKQLSGKDLIDFIYYKRFKGEIFDTLLDEYGTSKIEEAVAQVKGSQVRVSTTTPSTGSATLSKEEQQAADVKRQLFAGLNR